MSEESDKLSEIRTLYECERTARIAAQEDGSHWESLAETRRRLLEATKAESESRLQLWESAKRLWEATKAELATLRKTEADLRETWARSVEQLNSTRIELAAELKRRVAAEKLAADTQAELADVREVLKTARLDLRTEQQDHAQTQVRLTALTYATRGAACVSEVRREVREFAACMEQRLQRNDKRLGWRGVRISFLLTQLFRNAAGLLACSMRADGSSQTVADVARNAADVANYAMMIWDNFALSSGQKTGE